MTDEEVKLLASKSLEKAMERNLDTSSEMYFAGLSIGRFVKGVYDALVKDFPEDHRIHLLNAAMELWKSDRFFSDQFEVALTDLKLRHSQNPESTNN